MTSSYSRSPLSIGKATGSILLVGAATLSRTATSNAWRISIGTEPSMYSVPPGFNSLRQPLGEFVLYSTNCPSTCTLVHQAAIQVYLFPHNSLRALPPGNRHWVVVISDAILVIVPPSPCDDNSSGSVSGFSRLLSFNYPDQVDPDFPWLGKGY